MQQSSVFLLRTDSNELVAANLFDDIVDEHIELWTRTWLPQLDQARDRLTKSGAVLPKDLHWEWGPKAIQTRNMLAYKKFAIVCEDDLQGMMILRTPRLCVEPSQKSKDLVYVELLSTAPWNRGLIADTIRFRGVGTVLMRAAVEYSQQEQLKGRVGLSSLLQSEGFYHNCGMTDLGTDVPGSSGLRYFEMTEAQAKQFISS